MIRTVWSHALMSLLLFAAGNAALATGNYPGNAVRVNGVDVSYQRLSACIRSTSATGAWPLPRAATSCRC